MDGAATLTVVIPSERFTIFVGQIPGAGMSEQQAWIVELCRLTGYKPYMMHSGFAGVKIITPTGQQDISISEDGVYVMGPGWRVRVHDEKLPEAFKRAVETGVGDDMPEEFARLRAIVATAEGCAE